MGLNRREFLAGVAGAGIGFGLGALSHSLPLPPPRVGPDWRPGKEEFVHSACLLCPAHCGITARLVDGQLSRIDGNPLHPVSEGGLCAKGRAGIQLLYHPGRIQRPLRRVGPRGSDAFEAITWDAALAQVAVALRTAREQGQASTVAWVAGHTSGVMSELLAAFCAAYGTDRVTVDDYRDGSAEVLRLCQGIDAPPAYDLAGSDFVLSFGAALSEAWAALPLAARARDNEHGRRPRWVQVDVRLSRTAASADEWVAVRPGSYGVLALGLAYFMLKEGLYDVESVSTSVSGWEDWVDDRGATQVGFRRLVLEHGRPDAVSVRTGVPIPRIEALAKAFGAARSPVAVWDQAVAWRSGGLSDALAIHALNIIAGRLNRPGGILVQGRLPVPPLATARPSGSLDLARAPLTSAGGLWSNGENPARVLFMYCANPVASDPEPERVRQALARVPLVVSFSPFLDESARHADLVLPDHTYLERWQDAPAPASVPYPVWTVVQPVTRPLHDTRATGDVILDLAARLGGDVRATCPWPSVERIARDRGLALAGAGQGSAFVPAFRRKELRELERRGWWLSARQSSEDSWAAILAAGGWFDPFYDCDDRSGASQHADGRAWLYPAAARERLKASGTPLAAGFLPAAAERSATEEDAARSYPLVLVPYRVLTLASGGTSLMPWLLEDLGLLTGGAWEAWVELHPSTAKTAGLRAGQRVRVESATGALVARLRVFEGVQPGVVNAPYGLHTHTEGWGEPSCANPLVAVGRRADPATGLPDWHSTRVRVVPV